MTSGDELLNCPFCGGAAEVREWDFPYVRFQARCVECKTTGRTRFNERAKAIAAWNRRTPPTPATDTQEESMKLGGGTANGMRALGYQVLPPEPNSDSTCWRMIAPQYPNTEYLAADQAEGWRKAERHWHARNLENVFRRAPHTPAADGCTCFGDTGMQASTFCRSDDVRCCDLCGKPVASTPPTPATEDRHPLPGNVLDCDEAVKWITSNCMAIRRDNGEMDYSLGAMIAAFEAGRETRAAEILAAEANVTARIVAWLRATSTGLDLTKRRIADAIERNEHGAGK